MSPRLATVVLLTCLVVPTAATTAAPDMDLYEEPELADVLADPAADGYDRTFSMCQVEAKEFQATVRSTAYRVLKGVCNPGELEKYLDSMEERFNKKLDNFIDQISNIIRQNIGTDGKRDDSAATGHHRNENLPDSATKQTTWKMEKKKQYSTFNDKTKRLESTHLKHATTQNDNLSQTPLSAAEERRLAVQNLLPGGQYGSSGSTLFKTRAIAPSAVADWRVRPASSSPAPVTWPGSSSPAPVPWPGSSSPAPVTWPGSSSPAPGTWPGSSSPAPVTWPGGVSQGGTSAHHRQHSRHQYNSQVANGKRHHRTPTPAPPAGEQHNTDPKRHLGKGQHVTDTISYISPRQSALASRYSELPSYNDTVYYRNGKKMFSYYWKIENFSHMLSSWSPEHSIRSPSFYVYHGGYRMFLRLFPRRNGDSVLVRAALTSGRHDRSLPWPFRLPLRVSVLDHSSLPDDLQSRLWRPQREQCPRRTWQRPAQRRQRRQRRQGHQGRQGRQGRHAAHDGHACLGLNVPHTLLTRRRTLLADALLVKLDVFLEGDGGGSGGDQRGR